MSTQLRNPSFRSRLRLFFVFIVVVPMIAMAVVLFLLIGESQRRQTDSALSQAQLAVQQFDADLQAEAGQVAETIGRDQRLANARAMEDGPAIQDRLDALAERAGAAFVNLRLEHARELQGGVAAGHGARLAPPGRSGRRGDRPADRGHAVGRPVRGTGLRLHRRGGRARERGRQTVGHDEPGRSRRAPRRIWCRGRRDRVPRQHVRGQRGRRTGRGGAAPGGPWRHRLDQ